MLDAAEQAAIARRTHLRAAFEDLVAASTNANVDDEHDPEGATIAFANGGGLRASIDAGPVTTGVKGVIRITAPDGTTAPANY